jgi:hypothetical protein
MSFYVTLPSNSSIDTFPDNTLTKYTTKLKTSLKLEGPYEVALVEIMYPINWEIYSKAAITYINENKEQQRIELNLYAYDTLAETIEAINYKLKTSNGQILKYIHSCVHLQLPINTYLYFHYKAESIFGFSDKLYEGRIDEYISERRYNKINNINSLYIYSDILEYQYVGDVYAPLLRVVTVENKNNVYVDSIYDSPHYVPVLRNNIETIDIDIRSDNGNQILFQTGKVLVKLHFRRKNLYS